MRIGELLVMNGFISKEQLEEALEEQRGNPVKLGEILIAKHFINEGQLVEALEFQLGVPVIKLSETAYDPSSFQLIPESIARKHRIVPVGRDGGKLRVAMVDPLNQEAVRDIQMVSGLRVQPLIAAASEMDEAVVRYYGNDECLEEVNEILREGMKLQSSVIRLEAVEQGLMVKYPLVEQPPKERMIAKQMQYAVVERFKRMAGLNTREGMRPQSGRFQTDVDHKPLDVRVSTLPTRNGENLYITLTDPYTSLFQLSELELGEDCRQVVDRAITRQSGLILVSGPPGSGKTMLGYSLLQEIAKQKRKIITLEDPIVRTMPDMIQVEIAEHAGLTMASALRAALRHRPDTVMIDGMSDSDTADAAVLASRFGPLTIATMSAKSVLETLSRLMVLVRDSDALASTLSCIVSQRLARKICRQCAQTVPATEEELRLFDAHGVSLTEETKSSKGIIGNFRSFVSAQVSGKPAVTRGSGCRVCGETGFRGLVPIWEVLTLDPLLRECIAERKPIREIERLWKQNGGQSMILDGLQKAREGLTTADEVMKSVILTYSEGGNGNGISVSNR